MNRSKQTIVESKWLTWENALSFLSSVGTAFSFLLPDLLLWAFLWLSEFLILNNYKFQPRFHKLWDDKNKNHLNKTRWWRDCYLECDEQFPMNFTLRSSFYQWPLIFPTHIPNPFSNSFFQPKNFRNHDLKETRWSELPSHPILILSFSGIHGRRWVSLENKPWISDPFEHILHHFVLSCLWLSR